jgi:hypothetical protein
MAASHTPSGRGSQFADELGGFTGEAADGGELITRTAAMPMLAKPILPGRTFVPPPGTGDDEEPAPQTPAMPALAKLALLFKMDMPSAGASDPAGSPVNSKKAPARRSTPPASVSADAANAAGQAATAVTTLPLTAETAASAWSDELAQLSFSSNGLSWSATGAAPAQPSKSDAAPPTAQTDGKAAAGSSAHPQDLAFATRVQAIGSVDQSALPAEMAAAAAVASASKKVAASAPDGTSLAADSNALLASTLAVPPDRDAQPAALSSPAAPAATASTQNAEAPTTEAQTAQKPGAPLKDISLQVTQAGNERVDVRVVQQGNEVRVSVHSTDASLSSGLRQGLSELQGRLEENGYRAEMWRPAAAVTPLAATPGGHSAPDQSRGGDAQSHSGGSQQDGGRRNQNQSNQPRWVEELKSSLAGGEKSTGGSHGFSS